MSYYLKLDKEGEDTNIPLKNYNFSYMYMPLLNVHFKDTKKQL